MSSPTGEDDLVERGHRAWVERGWGASRGRLAFVLTSQIQRLVIERTESGLAGTDLTWTRWEALLVLYMSHDGSLTLGKLAERLMITSASVTGTVDRLVRDGYIVRQSHPTDRRATLAELSPAGRKIVEETTEMLVSNAYSIDGLTGQEVDQLILLLRKWRSQLLQPSPRRRELPPAL